MGWLAGRNEIIQLRLQPPKPTAYVNFGSGIEFTADFIVGMTLRNLIQFLQQNCSYRSIHGDEIPWLHDFLRTGDLKNFPADLDYVIQPGDKIVLDLTKLLSPVSK